MTKGAQIIYKGKPATYVGKIDQAGKKHLIKLATGEHKDVSTNEISTADEIAANKSQSRLVRQSERKSENASFVKQKQIQNLKNRKLELEAELEGEVEAERERERER